jgi:hypothetical protein
LGFKAFFIGGPGGYGIGYGRLPLSALRSRTEVRTDLDQHPAGRRSHDGTGQPVDCRQSSPLLTIMHNNQGFHGVHGSAACTAARTRWHARAHCKRLIEPVIDYAKMAESMGMHGGDRSAIEIQPGVEARD